MAVTRSDRTGIHKLPIGLMMDAFNNGKSQIKIEINGISKSGNSTLSGVIKPAEHFAISDNLLGYLQAEASVNLDDELFEFLKSRTAINKKQFSLIAETE